MKWCKEDEQFLLEAKKLNWSCSDIACELNITENAVTIKYRNLINSNYNKEKISKRNKQYYVGNKENILKQQKYYKTNNKEAVSSRNKQYRQKNKTKRSANQAKRRASKLQRTPTWSETELIKDFYRNRPEGYHVDHIIPLQGEIVCGLHVIANLQYLMAKENLKKGNKFNG